MTCLGEMATFMPGKAIYKLMEYSVYSLVVIVSGSFNHYATRFVEPSLGFALGWNYWFSVSFFLKKTCNKT